MRTKKYKVSLTESEMEQFFLEFSVSYPNGKEGVSS
jgi:hypothetical protein